MKSLLVVFLVLLSSMVSAQTRREVLKAKVDSTLHVRYNKVKLQYRLTDLLVQKKIGDFAKLAHKAYPDSVMPKHYNEAMAIWKMQHAKNIPDSLLSYTEKEYKDFVIFINKEPKPTPLEIRRKYKKTYWYYFFYGKTQ